MRLALGVKLALAAMLLFATGGPTVLAENESQLRPERIIRQQPQKFKLPSIFPWNWGRQQPLPQPQAVTPRQRREVARPVVARPRPVVVRDTPEAAKIAPTGYVAVLGDSLGEMLAQGLTDELAATRPELGVLRRAKADTGLARRDVYDWGKAVADLIAGNDSFSVVVMLIGANDRQALREDDGRVIEPGTDAWRAAYAQRVGGIARAFAARNVPVVWAGLPPMENARVAADMMALNDIFRAEVEKAGGVYVDLWEPFLDAQGRFSPYGPDVNGQSARLRTADGVHFTRAGARKAAHFTAQKVKQVLDRTPATAPLIAVAADPPQQVAALPPPGALGLPEPPGLPGAPVLPVRPLAGPIVPLTQPEISAGGVLLAAPAQRTASAADPLIERVFVEGRPTGAKAGRADDFAWPRP